MKKLNKLLFTTILILTLGLVSLPQNTLGAEIITYGPADPGTNSDPYGYCTKTGNLPYNNLDGTIFRLDYGNKAKGACHITWYHMAAPGTGSFSVEGSMKTQFSRTLTSFQMLQVANGVYSKTWPVLDAQRGTLSVRYFDISLNQYIKVVYYPTLENGKEYLNIVTMYPN